MVKENAKPPKKQTNKVEIHSLEYSTESQSNH